MPGSGYGLGTAVDFQLGVEALQMAPHRAWGNDEPIGDLRSREARREQPQHLQLTLAERLDQPLPVR